MASLGGNNMPPDIGPKLLFASIAGVACIAIGLSRLLPKSNKTDESPSLVRSIFLFCYSCFLKPHKGDGKGTQQDALESFYKTQAGVYDSTRKTLLRGREDMLALVAAQLKSRAQNGGRRKGKKTVWVDVGINKYLLDPMTSHANKRPRWVEVLVGTLRQCPNLSTFLSSSPASTLLTSLLPFVKWPASVLPDLVGRMSRSFAKMRGSFVLKIMKMISRACRLLP